MGKSKVAKDENWIEYLRERPEYAEELIQEVENRETAAIEAKYKDVLIAYKRTEFKLHGLVADIIKLEERQQSEGDSPELRKALQQAHEHNEKEWDRLSLAFTIKHGIAYDAYERELESANARFKELRILILS